MALVIVMTLVLIGGLVAFGLSRKSSETTASDKGDNPAAVDSGASAAATIPGPPTSAIPVGGTRAELCAKAAEYDAARTGLFDAAAQETRQAAYERAAPLVSQFDALLLVTPPDLYFQMANLRYHANQMGTPPEPDAFGEDSGVLSIEEIGRHYRAGLTPESNVTEVAAVDSFFATC